MTREESKYCEECKRCKEIIAYDYIDYQRYEVICNLGDLTHTKDNPIIYCKYKKKKKR